MVVHLVLYARLHVLILFGGRNCGRRPHAVNVLNLVSACPGSLRSGSARSELRHLPSCALTIRVGPIIQPGFLVTLSRWAVAHDNRTTTFAAANNPIGATFILLIFIIIVFVVASTRLRWRSSMILIILCVIHRLFGDGIICSIVFPRWDWRIGATCCLLPLEVVCILRGESIGMYTSIVAIHFSLAWRACIRHWNIICSWSSVPDGTVLRGILRTCIGIGRAATCTAGEFRGYVSSRLLCPVAVVLRMVYWLWRSHLLFLSLFSSFLESSFKTILHSLSSSASTLINLYSGHINLRSLFSKNCLIELLIVVPPPLRVN